MVDAAKITEDNAQINSKRASEVIENLESWNAFLLNVTCKFFSAVFAFVKWVPTSSTEVYPINFRTFKCRVFTRTFVPFVCTSLCLMCASVCLSCWAPSYLSGSRSSLFFAPRVYCLQVLSAFHFILCSFCWVPVIFLNFSSLPSLSTCVSDVTPTVLDVWGFMLGDLELWGNEAKVWDASSAWGVGEPAESPTAARFFSELWRVLCMRCWHFWRCFVLSKWHAWDFRVLASIIFNFCEIW